MKIDVRGDALALVKRSHQIVRDDLGEEDATLESVLATLVAFGAKTLIDRAWATPAPARGATPFIDAHGIAATLNGSESTVRYWIATGQLASEKIGRRRLVRRDVAAAFLKVDVSELAP